MRRKLPTLKAGRLANVWHDAGSVSSLVFSAALCVFARGVGSVQPVDRHPVPEVDGHPHVSSGWILSHTSVWTRHTSA